MKQIIYRGGLVKFRLPNSWIEEYEADGGGTFYEDKPNSGTLRLNVLSFKATDEKTSEIVSEAIAEQFQHSRHGQVDILPNGNVLQKYTETAVEDGEELLIYYWKLGSPIPPQTIRIALFSYTILSNQAEDAKAI
jgi:hypothetical protein